MATGITSPLKHSPVGVGGKYAYRSGMGMVPSAEFLVFHDDFVDAVTTNLPAGWDAAIIDTGATLVTDTTAAYGTGVLLFDSDGATEGVAIYGEKSIQLTAGKKFFMEMRFQTELADDSDVQFGLSSLDVVTDPEDMWDTSTATGVAFGVLDGSAYTTMVSDLANAGPVTTTSTTKAITAATWHTYGIGYDGNKLKGYLDGKLALTHTGLVPVGVALAPFFGFRNGSAATTEGHVDYVRYVLER